MYLLSHFKNSKKTRNFAPLTHHPQKKVFDGKKDFANSKADTPNPEVEVTGKKTANHSNFKESKPMTSSCDENGQNCDWLEGTIAKKTSK